MKKTIFRKGDSHVQRQGSETRTYLSFLGLGSKKESTGKYDYDPTVYELNGIKSKKTKFVQVAELEILGASEFDRVIIVATQRSYDTHFKDSLKIQLEELGPKSIEHLIISEDMTPEGQWKWFEQILERIEHDSALTVDLTHGYRSIPIIFSTAINFLQKSKNIKLEAVYYGAYDSNRQLVPIIDMKEFYTINDWAEAVGRLVEDADARKLARVADTTPAFQARELNDKTMIQAFEDLTNTLRNVDVNNVCERAARALEFVVKKEGRASETGRILFDILKHKFSSLAVNEGRSGEYDEGYFRVQLEIIRILLEHKFFMQAYTAMRELIGSIGMVGIKEIKKPRVNNAKGRGYRTLYSGVFVNMFQFKKEEWKFDGKEEKAKNELLPFYQQLENLGIESKLREFIKKPLIDYRNGFDHAWTAKSQASPDIEEQGEHIYQKLCEVVDTLCESGIVGGNKAQ